MKKRNKFNIRGNLKKKLIVALYGVSTLLGVWIAKEAKENLDAEIALAAAKPVAQEVAYVEDSECEVLSHENDSEKVEKEQPSTSDKGVVKNFEDVMLWGTFGTLCLLMGGAVVFKFKGKVKEKVKERKYGISDEELRSRLEEDIKIEDRGEVTPDSDFTNTKEDGFKTQM